MTQIPEENYALELDAVDRSLPPRQAGEKETLVAFLDWHRATLAAKCAGVPPERLSDQVVPPSTLSLHGLVRHLAAVERWWFRQQFAGEDLPILYYSDEDPDQDFESLDGDVGEALNVWRAECDCSRAIVAAASLDDRGRAPARRGDFTLRWLLVNMLAEYARHNGHADLLRERIDGATGY